MKWIVRIALVVWIVIGLALYIPVFKEYHMNKVQFINVWTYNVQLKNDYEYLINVKKLSEEQAKEKLGLKADTILPSKEALASYYKDYVKPFETAFYEQLEKTTITFLVFTIIIGMVVVGFDWTYRKKKGKFQVVLEYGIDGNGKRIRKYKTFDKESEAKKYLIQMLANEGKFIPLNEFLDRWLEEYAKNYVAPKTYIKYKDSLKHVRKAFPSHTLQQLNTFELQKFFNQLSQTLSQASVRKIYSVLNNALKTAIKWNMLKENPLEFVKLPQKYEEKKIKVWDIETVKKFLEDIKDEKIHTAVTLALHAGLRAGEICGLTWDNVDFEKKCIHIKQALQKIGKEIIIKPPKSKTSIRTIYMTSYLYETLLEEYKRQEPLREAYKKLGNFVCIHETGNPFCPDYFTHTFKKLVSCLGYPEIRFHDLRHTFATILLQAQTNPKIAAEILGHSNTKLFLNLYAHVLDEQKIKATHKIEEILG